MSSLTISTNASTPVYVQPSTTQTITTTSNVSGMLSITGPQPGNYGAYPVPISGSLNLQLPYMVPPQWQELLFYSQALQAARIARPFETSEEIAKIAYKDARALIDALQQIKDVTSALTDAAPKQAESASWVTGTVGSGGAIGTLTITPNYTSSP